MLLCVVSFSPFSELLLLFPESTVINRRFPSSCTRGFASVRVLLLSLLVVVLPKTLTQLWFGHCVLVSCTFLSFGVCQYARSRGSDSIGSAQFKFSTHPGWLLPPCPAAPSLPVRPPPPSPLGRPFAVVEVGDTPQKGGLDLC